MTRRVLQAFCPVLVLLQGALGVVNVQHGRVLLYCINFAICALSLYWTVWTWSPSWPRRPWEKRS